MRITGALVVGLALLAGCSTGEPGETETTAAATTAAAAAPVVIETTAAEPVAEPEVACEAAPQAVLDAIGSGAQDGTGMAVKAGQMFLSPDFSKVYFVAATFSATGVSDQVGVWATNDPAGTGAVMSVDGTAKQFTVWPDAEKTDAAIRADDPSVNVVKGCLD